MKARTQGGGGSVTRSKRERKFITASLAELDALLAKPCSQAELRAAMRNLLAELHELTVSLYLAAGNLRGEHD